MSVDRRRTVGSSQAGLLGLYWMEARMHNTEHTLLWFQTTLHIDWHDTFGEATVIQTVWYLLYNYNRGVADGLPTYKPQG